MADFIYDVTSGELGKGNNAEPNTWTAQSFAGGSLDMTMTRFKIRVRTANACTFRIELRVNSTNVIAGQSYTVSGATTARWYEIEVPNPWRIITSTVEIRVSHISASRNSYYVMYKTSPRPLAGTSLYQRTFYIGGVDEVITNATALCAIYDQVVIPEEPVEDTPKKWDGTAWVNTSVKRWDGGLWVPAKVNKVVLPDRRYFDVASKIEAIKNGTAYDLAPMHVAYDLTYNHTATDQVLSGNFTGKAVDPSSTAYKQTLALMVDQLAKYPPGFISGIALARILLTRKITNTAKPDTNYNGVASGDQFWVDVEALDNPTEEAIAGLERTVHHELFHIFNNTWPAEIAAFQNEWVSKNPMAYQGDDYKTLYPGRPAGFTRWYATVNYKEDLADVFGYIMSTRNQAQLVQMMNEDPIVAWKVNRLKQFMATLSDAFKNSLYYQAIHSTS